MKILLNLQKDYWQFMSICRSLEKHEASSLVFLIQYTVVHKLWVRNKGKDTLKLRENQQRFLPEQWKSAYYWSTFYTISSILQGFASPNNFNFFLSDKGIYAAIKWNKMGKRLSRSIFPHKTEYLNRLFNHLSSQIALLFFKYTRT